jgi:dicarboxylate transporter 10
MAMTQKPQTMDYAALLLGGASSMMACVCTHPLDTLKVHMQVNEKAISLNDRPAGMIQTAINVVKTRGVSGLYKGLSAALMRQATYSTTRFAAYDAIKFHLDEGGKKKLSLYERSAAAMLAGAAGGLAGNPMDVTNVRMQVIPWLADCPSFLYSSLH